MAWIQAWRGMSLAYPLATVLAAIIVAALLAYIQRTRESTVAGALDGLGRLNVVLAQHVERSLFGADLLVTALQEDTERLGAANSATLYERMARRDMHESMRELVFNNADVESLNFADTRGRLITSRQWPPSAVNVSDRDYFKALRGGAAQVISLPAVSKVTGQEIVLLGRRVQAPSGEFLGIVYAAISTRRFTKLFEDALLDRREPVSMILFRRDGAVLAQYLAEGEKSPQAQWIWRTHGAELRRQDVLNATLDEPVADDESASGIPRRWLLALRNGQSQGFSLALAVPEDVALSQWHENSRLVYAFMGTAVLLCPLVAWSFIRLGRAREEAADLARRLGHTNSEFADANRRLQDAQRHAMLGYWQVDLADGKWTWSEELRSLLELPSPQRRPSYAALRAVVHPEDRDAVDEFHDRALHIGDRAADSTEGHDLRLLMAAGRVKHVVMRSWVRRDESGQPTHVAGSMQDVTSIRAAEEDLRRSRAAEEAARLLLQRVLDSIPVRVFWKDRDFNYLGCNRLFARDAGLEEPAQLIGRSDFEMGWHEQAEAYQADDRRVIDSGESRIGYEEPQTTPEGGKIWLQTNKLPLRDASGSIFGVLGTYEDITQRKQVEEDLRAAQQAAEAANRAKSLFLANMSHEIRTPLNAVLGLAQNGLRKNVHPLATEDFGRIHSAGRRLLGVVNDILDFSKIEAGKLDIESHPFRLDTVVADALALVAADAEKKGLQVRQQLQSADLHVKGDVQRLGQVLANLLSNAVKFTERGSVTLAVRREGAMTRFDVVDTGIGIDGAQLPRLFAPFEQVDGSTTRKYGGTGLGLAISRNLARLMGGEISVTSRPNEGSTFTLRVPLPAADPVAAAADGREPELADKGKAKLSGLRILVAEDVDLNRVVVEDMLASEGAQVSLAWDGLQAVQLVQQHGAGAFDIVLMDLQMPNLDGIEAARRILAIAPSLPIIGLTAHAMVEERERCLAAGMLAHLTKPIDAVALIQTIRRHAGRSGAAAGTGPAPVAQAVSKLSGPIDWAALDKRYEYRHEWIRKLLKATLRQYTDAPRRLRDAANQGDASSIAFVAHNIKGGIGAIEAGELFSLASRVEHQARGLGAETPQEATPLANELADRLDDLLRFLRERIA